MIGALRSGFYHNATSQSRRDRQAGQGSVANTTLITLVFEEGPRTFGFFLSLHVWGLQKQAVLGGIGLCSRGSFSYLLDAMEDNSTSGDAAGSVVRANEDGKRSLFYQVYTHCWFQIILISFICFCCPGVGSLRSLHDLALANDLTDVDVQCTFRSRRLWSSQPDGSSQCHRRAPRCDGSYCAVRGRANLRPCWSSSMPASGWMDLFIILWQLVVFQR